MGAKPVNNEDGRLKWPLEVRQVAFELWAFRADLNSTKTAELLASEHGYDVPARTVAHWVGADDWHSKLKDFSAALGPELFERSKLVLVGSAPLAAAYVRDVIAGAAAPDRVRVQAAFGLLDRVGFMPWNKIATLPTNPANLSRTRSADNIAPDSYADLDTHTLALIASGELDPADLPPALSEQVAKAMDV